MTMLIRWLIMSLAILVIAYILPGVSIVSFIAALAAALILGLINIFIRPILIILTLPINILTLGLFTLILNALLILLAAAIVPGFTVVNFWWALLFSIILSLTMMVVGKLS